MKPLKNGTPQNSPSRYMIITTVAVFLFLIGLAALFMILSTRISLSSIPSNYKGPHIDPNNAVTKAAKNKASQTMNDNFTSIEATNPSLHLFTQGQNDQCSDGGATIEDNWQPYYYPAKCTLTMQKVYNFNGDFASVMSTFDTQLAKEGWRPESTNTSNSTITLVLTNYYNVHKTENTTQGTRRYLVSDLPMPDYKKADTRITINVIEQDSTKLQGTGINEPASLGDAINFTNPTYNTIDGKIQLAKDATSNATYAIAITLETIYVTKG